uniref:Molybdopterin oxidoreductase n=1 Tax=Magnetococcus massalia (strain MO-1) TaxID=451514 RepID=A0A1S7LIR2_MAGMO|nr:Molybdopterin oxidoreductase [Candidatus Magnetococcus massalia]
MTTHNTTCPLDCPSACALKVEVEGDRLLKVRGNPDHPFTRGVICNKVARYGELQHGERLTTPMKRVGPKGLGHFEPISWDEALESVTEQFKRCIAEHGAESIWPYWYGGTMGIVQRKAIQRLTHRAGFSRLERTLCASIASAGWAAGVNGGHGPSGQDMAEGSDLIILWGINAVSTHINLMNFVKDARKRGVRLVVIDPYRNRTARLADMHIAPRPGTDGALASAMMHVMLKEGLADRDYMAKLSDFDDDVEAHLADKTPQWAAEITGLSADVIRNFARVYGQAEAPYIRIGMGMSRHNNGAVNVHAISALTMVAGAWKNRGGGALLMCDSAFHMLQDGVVSGRQFVEANPARTLDMSRLGAILNDKSLETPVSAMLVQSCNPAVTVPDLGAVYRGLTREDLFLVVHEQVMSETALFADILLPATSFLEHADLYSSYGQTTLQHAQALLPPTGEAKSNHWLINQLAQKLGFAEQAFTLTEEQTIDQMLADSGLPAKEAWSDSWLDLTPDEETRHFRNGFPQSDGKFHFKAAWPNPEMPAMPDHWPVNRRDLPQDRDYPLDFMTPPAHEVLNSTFTSSPKAVERMGPPKVWMHPEDAKSRGIEEGDRVVVYNALAYLSMSAHVTEDVRPGVTLCETNHPASALKEKISINALSHGERVQPGGGPAFHDNRVQIEKVT